MDIAKSKIQSFDKARPYMAQIQMYALIVWNILKSEKIDRNLYVFYLSKMVYWTLELNEKFGGWLLFDNLHADSFLSHLYFEATKPLSWLEHESPAEIGKQRTYL